MGSAKARLIDEDGCRIRVVHLEKVEQARREAISDRDLARLSLTYKVLGDPNRLKIVMVLRNVEMCVCDLAALLGVSESAASRPARFRLWIDTPRARTLPSSRNRTISPTVPSANPLLTARPDASYMTDLYLCHVVK